MQDQQTRKEELAGFDNPLDEVPEETIILAEREIEQIDTQLAELSSLPKHKEATDKLNKRRLVLCQNQSLLYAYECRTLEKDTDESGLFELKLEKAQHQLEAIHANLELKGKCDVGPIMDSLKQINSYFEPLRKKDYPANDVLLERQKEVNEKDLDTIDTELDTNWTEPKWKERCLLNKEIVLARAELHRRERKQRMETKNFAAEKVEEAGYQIAAIIAHYQAAGNKEKTALSSGINFFPAVEAYVSKHLPSSIESILESIQNGRRRLPALPFCEPPTAGVNHLPSSGPSVLSLGVIATAGLCLAFVLKRFYNRFTAKRRDSFGFEPDSCRASLNAAERMV